MAHTLRINTASYEHVVGGIFICDADFTLEIGYDAERSNGEVYDYWIEAIGSTYYDMLQGKPVLNWIPEQHWKEPFIKAALDYFKSHKFAYRVQEAADEARDMAREGRAA